MNYTNDIFNLRNWFAWNVSDTVDSIQTHQKVSLRNLKQYCTMTLKLQHEVCGTFHNITELSIFSVASSATLGAATGFMNWPIFYCITKAKFYSDPKYRVFFYKLLINIAFADLLKGIIGGASSVVYHIKEALHNIQQVHIDAPIVHLSLLITDAAALVSITILSIDRIIALLFPIKYRTGFSTVTQNLIVLSIWPLAMAIVVPYFKTNYIKELAIFAGIAITIAVSSLIILTYAFKKKFNYKLRSINKQYVSSSEISTISEPHQLKDPLHGNNMMETVSKMNRQPIKKKFSDESISSFASINSESLMCRNQVKSTNTYDVTRKPIPKNSQAMPGSQLNKSRPESFMNQIDPSLEQIPDIPNDIFRYKGRSVSMNTKSEMVFSSIDKPIYENTALNKSCDRPITPEPSTGSQSSIKRKAQPKLSRHERRVTETFMKMLMVFMGTYTPIVISIIYMNVSSETYVHCVVRHVLRDLTVVFILLSSLLRGLNFIMTLRRLRKLIKSTFNIENFCLKG